MEINVSKRLTGFICVVPLIYFAGVSLYSFIPEMYDVDKQILAAFYWANNTFFVASLSLASSRIVVPKKPKLILFGVFLFTILLGCFQVAYVFVDLPTWIWIAIFPAFLIPYLIVLKYVRS